MRPDVSAGGTKGDRPLSNGDRPLSRRAVEGGAARRPLHDAFVAAGGLAIALVTSMAALGCDRPPPASTRIESHAPTWAELSTRGEATICFTEGRGAASERGHHVVDAAMRGFVPGSTGDEASLDFVYRGTLEKRTELASGDSRAQLGVKLRAADSCNVLYAMWRTETNEIVVQVKRNADAHTHAECGATGYTRVRPTERAKPPTIAAGEHHTLEAVIAGDNLVVKADDTLVWRGTLPDEARELRGPAGVRTDNVDVDLAIHAPIDRDRPVACPRSPRPPRS